MGLGFHSAVSFTVTYKCGRGHTVLGHCGRRLDFDVSFPLDWLGELCSGDPDWHSDPHPNLPGGKVKVPGSPPSSEPVGGDDVDDDDEPVTVVESLTKTGRWSRAEWPGGSSVRPVAPERRAGGPSWTRSVEVQAAAVRS